MLFQTDISFVLTFSPCSLELDDNPLAVLWSRGGRLWVLPEPALVRLSIFISLDGLFSWVPSLSLVGRLIDLEKLEPSSSSVNDSSSRSKSDDRATKLSSWFVSVSWSETSLQELESSISLRGNLLPICLGFAGEKSLLVGTGCGPALAMMRWLWCWR